MVNETLEHLRGYLAQRSPRERQTLALGGVILLVLVGYGLIYQPLREARNKLAERLPLQRAELRLMRAQAEEVERLRKQIGGAGTGTLEQRIKSSAAALGLTGDFTQFIPLSGAQFQIATQPMATATWIGWLGDLERQGIIVARCRITSGAQPGLASLELTLKGGPR